MAITVYPQPTQPVSAVALPLPSGASTSALQTQPGVDIGDVTVNNAAGAAAVNVQDGGNSLTVDGTVTASAGTNLNTSALALESGGVLSFIQTNTSNIEGNTVPFGQDFFGGYVQQDSNATIAKESDGNLETIAAVDFATEASLDDVLSALHDQNEMMFELVTKFNAFVAQRGIFEGSL